tara:strand:- start:237 stop:416 length:180 start_codon:yes stop_codon:yes gene_type:complete
MEPKQRLLTKKPIPIRCNKQMIRRIRNGIKIRKIYEAYKITAKFSKSGKPISVKKEQTA